MNIFEIHTFADPRSPFIFHEHTYLPSEKVERFNWHENIEIIYCKSGDATVRIGGTDVLVSNGDIAVISSNLLHGIIAHSRFDFYCLIIDRSFCIANHIDTNLISFEQKITDSEIAAEFDLFAKNYSDAELPFRTLSLRSCALKMLTLLCTKYSLKGNSVTAETHLLSAVKHALGYIYSESHRPLSLDEIASAAGLSKYYLAHEFKRLTGHTVIDYLNGVRCEKAAALLAEKDLTVECIAEECGFSNTSYFIKTFKSFYGISPGQYKNRF